MPRTERSIRLPRRGLSVILCLACAAVSLSAAPPRDLDEYRWGVIPGTDFAALRERSTVTEMVVENWRDPASGELRLSGWSDVHGVFDVPLEAVVRVLTDYEGQPRYSPRLFSARVVSRDEGRVRVFQEVGFTILGIRSKYRVVVDFEEANLPEGGFGQRSRLVDSPDGNLYESYSSWYVLPVTVDGRTLVYVRGYSRPGIRRPFLGMAGALRLFTPGEVKSLLANYIEEARRISGVSR